MDKIPTAAALRKAHKHALFIEAYISSVGRGRGKAAAIAAGYSPKSAHTIADRLLSLPAIKAEIARRRAEVLAKAQEKTQLTSEEVLASLARDIRFDPAKLYDEKGALKRIQDLDEDTRLALRAVEVDEIKQGGKVAGYTIKVKFPEKTSAREQGMKHFGLYEKDNNQKPQLPSLEIKFVPS